MRRIWFAPLGAPAVVCVFAGAMVLGAAQTITLWSWNPVDLRDVLATIRELTLVWPIPLGLCAVWLAAAHDSSSVVGGSGAPARPRRELVRAHARVGIVIAGGALVGWLPSAVRAALFHPTTPGSYLALGTLSASLIALWFALYTAACFVNTRVGTVLVPALGFVLVGGPMLASQTILTDTGASGVTLGWMWGMALPRVGWEFNAAIEFMRLLFFLAVAVIAWLVAVGGAEFRGTGDVAGLRPLGLLVVPVAVAVAAGWLAPPLATRVDEALRCRDDRSFRICVYPKEASIAESLSSEVGGVLRLVPTAVLTPALTLSQEPSATVQVSTSFSDRDRWAAQVRSEAAYGAFLRGCAPTSASELPSSHAIARTVAEELLTRSQGVPTYSAFARLSDQAFTAWLDAHAERVRSCTLTQSDLP